MPVPCVSRVICMSFSITAISLRVNWVPFFCPLQDSPDRVRVWEAKRLGGRVKSPSDPARVSLITPWGAGVCIRALRWVRRRCLLLLVDQRYMDS